MLSRKDARKKVAELVQGAVTEFVAVYPYKATDLKGQSPVMTIASSGYRPQQLAANAYWTTYHFTLNMFILYSDQGAGWTEDLAEDLNDDLAEKIIDCLFESRTSEFWTSIVVEDRTFTDEVQLGGVTYLNEVIMIALEMTP